MGWFTHQLVKLFFPGPSTKRLTALDAFAIETNENTRERSEARQVLVATQAALRHEMRSWFLGGRKDPILGISSLFLAGVF